MKIELTDREINLLMTALGTHIGALENHPNAHEPQLTELITELFELETDMREALHRQNDGWGDLPPAQEHKEASLEGHTFTVGADDFIQAGMDAREQQKATSRAQNRRNERMMAGTASPVDWNPSDPGNW